MRRMMKSTKKEKNNNEQVIDTYGTTVIYRYNTTILDKNQKGTQQSYHYKLFNSTNILQHISLQFR